MDDSIICALCPGLEIGAVNTQLLDCPQLETRAIDLRASHPRIERRDFFALPEDLRFDIVVCALVLNCVETAARRGAMLAKIRRHLGPPRDDETSSTNKGLLFLVVPRTCVERSRAMRPARFAEVLAEAGFGEIVDRRESPKLLHLCLRATAPATAGDGRADVVPSSSAQPKRRPTNDFDIVLPASVLGDRSR
mmetsp:Transcript_13456/g.54008  ORF Transcript_13456/g.54008 Transcript_13456/m.54008 type:complete len:193 (-) Transcript_13456:650-1228(-)